MDYLLKLILYFLKNNILNDINNCKEIYIGFFIKINENINNKICDEYIKECVGDGYSLNIYSFEE